MSALSLSFCSLVWRSEVLLVVFLQLVLLVLRIEQTVDRFDLALDACDALDRVLHLVDQAALDRFGELDLADPLRHLDAGAHRRPACACGTCACPCGRALRRLVELLVQLLGGVVGLADGVDLLLHLARPLGDALVGDLLVVEDHQLANGAVAALQLVAEVDDLLGHQRRARDRLDDRQLAALDAAGDFDLAFAGEQRHGAHLAQVHAHRVVGLVERARRQVELELLRSFGGAVDRSSRPADTSGRSR